MSSWGYVALGYLLTLATLAVFVWRSERRIGRLRRVLRARGRRG